MTIPQPACSRVRATFFRPHAPISRLELFICFAFFSSVVLLGLTNVYRVASKTSAILRVQHWAEDKVARFIPNHYQDIADVEWEAFENHWISFTICGLLNAAVSKTIRHLNLQWLRHLTVIAVGLVTLVTTCGLYNAAFYLAEAIVIYATMRISCLPLPFGWLFAAVHIFLPLPPFANDSPVLSGNKFAAIYAIWAWMWNVMRYVSFGSELQWQMEEEQAEKIRRQEIVAENSNEPVVKPPKQPLAFDFLNFLSYLLYAPTIFGSVITYRHFYDQAIRPFNSSSSSSDVESHRSFKIRPFLRQIAVISAWLVVYLLSNELFMFYTLEQRATSIRSLSGFGAGVSPWAHGQYFQAKYMVLYGMPWLLAYLDHGVELTPLPVCVSRVYLYSDMWKYFDTGLYDFLKTYIYIPVAKSMGRQLGGAITFFFIWSWHGTNKTIALWTCCNFVQIVLEGLLRQASNDERSLLFKYVRSRVSPSNWRRLEALAGGVSFTFSCFAIAFFLMGFRPASYIVSRTFLPTTINFWMYVLTSYAWVQTVFSYENWWMNSPL